MALSSSVFRGAPALAASDSMPLRTAEVSLGRINTSSTLRSDLTSLSSGQNRGVARQDGRVRRPVVHVQLLATFPSWWSVKHKLMVVRCDAESRGGQLNATLNRRGHRVRIVQSALDGTDPRQFGVKLFAVSWNRDGEIEVHPLNLIVHSTIDCHGINRCSIARLVETVDHVTAFTRSKSESQSTTAGANCGC